MRIKRLLPLLLVLLFLGTTYCHAQLWSGVLAPARAIDWSHAGATIQNRTTICTTLSPGVTAAQINSAILSCPAGQVVYLNAGTYNLSASIVTTTSNVTLRGAGPDQTFLVFSTTSSNCSGLGATAICIWNGDSHTYSTFDNSASWTANYSAGTNQITLSSTTNLKVGSLVILNQQDDASDTGNIYVCATTGSGGPCSIEGTAGFRTGWGQTQTSRVTGISGHLVTINPPIYTPNWASVNTPQGWWSSTLPISGFGLENLSIDFSAAGSGWSGVQFWNAYNSWAKNVRTINNYTVGSSFTEHFGVYGSAFITVRDSYIYGSNPASQGYGIDLGEASTACLVENNITQHTATGYMTKESVGSVFGYNYAVDNFYNGNGSAPSWQQNDSYHHSVFSAYDLWEGHEGIGFSGDDIHGTSGFLTVFRSYFNGRDPATVDYSGTAKTHGTNALMLSSFSRYYSIVGSVFGTQSYHTQYINYPTSSLQCGTENNTTVTNAGWSAGRGVLYGICNGLGTFNINNDISIYNGANTGNLLLWGNYTACTGDASCNAVRWQASENSSGASTYPGLGSPSQTLPASFYYSGQPSWWPSTITWPPIGPDVTGGNVANVGGHVYLTPAANCYLNVMGGKTDGSSRLLTFNANACYAPAPAAPSNLTATPI